MLGRHVASVFGFTFSEGFMAEMYFSFKEIVTGRHFMHSS